MKIMIVCPKLSHGGAERVGVVLANGFVHRGHQVCVVADLNKPVTYQLDEHVTLRNLVSSDKYKFLKWLRAVITLRKIIKEEKPHVIIGILELFSFVSKLATIGMKIPIIATEHDSFERPVSAPMSRIESFFKYYVNKMYGTVTLLTQADQICVEKYLSNTMVMPNPLCLPVVNTVPEKDKIILAAGRVDNWHYKGLDILIKSWGGIAKKYPDWKLQIAGVWLRKESREYLDEIAAKFDSLDRIEYLGFQENMLPIYQRSSIFVLSSRYEGFGLVLIEAMSQGCACVACDYKRRQSEILEDGKDGIVCLPESVDDLKNSIEKMISDKELREKYQNRAIERAEYYSIDHTMDRWERLLQKVVLNHR